MCCRLLNKANFPFMPAAISRGQIRRVRLNITVTDDHGSVMIWIPTQDAISVFDHAALPGTVRVAVPDIYRFQLWLPARFHKP
jgi:hypothetical protein